MYVVLFLSRKEIPLSNILLSRSFFSDKIMFAFWRDLKINLFIIFVKEI